MIVNPYFSYIRVSTLKQGQTGTSLAEQQSAIGRYAERAGLTIVREFEERETAAKQGRPVFNDMLKALKAGKARGVIIHKIDRSARNLQDWVQLQQLTDNGIEIHFANESIDLQSRGGRLSADIQAVVAADYIRNLREETRKGFYGRIKQGLYPRPAPPGYLDCGKGKPKAIDPVNGPLVRRAFELYATGRWGLVDLADHMKQLGLRGKKGKPIRVNGLSIFLHNIFYCGLVRLKISGEIYEGQHEPIISKKLFDQVQDVLAGKTVERHYQHSYLFRRLITCVDCHMSLVGEMQKGSVYYRCHTRRCPQKTLREDLINERIEELLRTLKFNDAELEYVRDEVKRSYSTINEFVESRRKGLQLQIDQSQTRLTKLTDMYIDGTVDQEMYIRKKNDLLLQETEAKEKLKNTGVGEQLASKRIEEFVELVNNAYSSYKKAFPDEKRELIKIISSNLELSGKSLVIKLHFPFQIVSERQPFPAGAPQRDVPRTVPAWISQLIEYFKS